MKIWDITRELLSSPPYPGDPPPVLHTLSHTAYGDAFTVSELHCCTHAGTHLDAPLHCFPDGEDVASLAPERLVGECTVMSFDGILLGDEAERLLPRLSAPRLLLRGRAELSGSAAFVLAGAGLQLLGVESASAASATAETAVHRELLGAGTVFGAQVLPESVPPIGILTMAPGAFFVLAFLVAVQNRLRQPKKGKPAKKEAKEGCGGCAACGLCGGDKKEETV